jgi:hypothetical protein
MSTRVQKSILFGIIVAALCVLLQSSALADTPHGRDCATAPTIELNAQAGGTFADTDDRVVYRIVLERRGLLDVWTEAGNLDLWDAELLDSSCNKVAGVGAGNSVVRNKYIRITVPHVNLKPEENVWTLDPGVYFLRFRPDPVDVFGDPFVFHTSFIPHYGHDTKTAEYVDVPASIDGFLLYPEDREVFRVQLPYSGEIHAWTTGPNESAARPSISLSGPPIADESSPGLDDSTGQAIQTSVLKPGDYYLSLEPMQPDQLGPFTLHVEFMKIH